MNELAIYIDDLLIQLLFSDEKWRGWHRWFAWRPTFFGGKTHWLVPVERCVRRYSEDGSAIDYWFEYRDRYSS